MRDLDIVHMPPSKITREGVRRHINELIKKNNFKSGTYVFMYDRKKSKGYVKKLGPGEKADEFMDEGDELLDSMDYKAV